MFGAEGDNNRRRRDSFHPSLRVSMALTGSLIRARRVLILTPRTSRRDFLRGHISRVLVWSLDSKGIAWELHHPRTWRSDIQSFDAVLSWPYGFKKNPMFLSCCVDFERRATRSGVLAINALAGCDFRHSWCLRLWRAKGITCAPYQHVTRWQDIRLPYPLILRTDRVHQGRNMFVARDELDARAIFERPVNPPIDLAVQFIDTKAPDGYYRKWRSHVVGNKVIPRQAQLSADWKVNLDGANSCALAAEECKHFLDEGESNASLLVRAAKVLKSDIIALDYSKKLTGEYIFWEGNRIFDLSIGGEMWNQFRSSTGLTDEQCVARVKVLGDAIADLIPDFGADGA